MTSLTDSPSSQVIREWLLGLNSFSADDFDEGVLVLEVNSVCGQDCVKVLKIADQLCELCADTREDIRTSAITQVNVFYFG
jgi:hypothetical protein